MVFFLVLWEKSPYFSLCSSPGSGALGKTACVEFTLDGFNSGSVLRHTFGGDFYSGSTGMRIGDTESICVAGPFHTNRFSLVVSSGVCLRPRHRRLCR